MKIRICGFVSRRPKSGLTAVEVTVISGVVLALGIFLIYVANNWYFSSTIETADEVDENVQLIRSALAIEKITYNYTDNTADITIRNVARDGPNLKIIAVEVLSMDGRPYSRLSLSDLNYILGPGEHKDLDKVPACTSCHKGDILRFRIWYVPEKHAGDQFSIPGEAIFVESSFIYAGGEINLACPLPQNDNYLLIGIVDPVLSTDGVFSSGEVRIKLVRPAFVQVPSNISLKIDVTGLRDNLQGSGILENVQVSEVNYVTVRGDYRGIRVPLKITVNPLNDETKIIQEGWIMGGDPNRAYVSGISLLWRETDYMVYAVIVDIGAKPLTEDLSVKVSVRIKDCKGNIVGEVDARERIPAGMDVDLPVFINLHEAVRFDQIYFVEANIVEVEN
ncbi:MAG: hypothetical protein RMI78_03810 [Nitrososphaerota archaeon]|nr:hypothetical protein [Nitrososphaerota archaeon]